jgi:hypothetical protein
MGGFDRLGKPDSELRAAFLTTKAVVPEIRRRSERAER